ncbi:MAG: UDP-3-O-(3-hydroxymyristoyl)glucosamine N-acyltransferase [Gammaproteobacteria bacterium]|nr:MAG: UDP-3-O-(3-hydroxymyristoyl)glucosamine N-acyltransferase [Gammaproteobacteria bacterium]
MKLGDIALEYGCELRGDPDHAVTRVATLAAAEPDAVAFLANPAYRGQLAATRAGAVILTERDADASPVAALVTANPYLVYARLAARLHPLPAVAPGISPAAVLAADCELPASCAVAAGAVIDSGARLGERVQVGPNACIGRDVRIGDDSRLLAGVCVAAGSRIGARCVLHQGVVIGSDGFGNARTENGEWVKVPQLGAVRIGDDVEIGANTTIDRGAIDDTVIEDGVRLDNQIQVGHNVRIGAHTAIAALTGISGSTTIGRYCMIGGQVGFAGHLEIADHVVISGGTAVTHSIRRPGVYGGPASGPDEVSRWRRNAVRYQQLDDMAKRLRRLEKWAAQAQAGED